MNRRILPARVASQLEVLHQDVAVADPALSVVRIVNTGDRAVRPQDFETDLTLTFDGVQELVSASWSATRPLDLRPHIQLAGNCALMEPKLINPGDMLELQVLSAGSPTDVSLGGRIAELVIVRRDELPYPPGSGLEGEMLGFDRFMWFVFSPALVIGMGLVLAVSTDTSLGFALILVGTALVLAAYLIHIRYLVRRRRRWRP